MELHKVNFGNVLTHVVIYTSPHICRCLICFYFRPQEEMYCIKLVPWQWETCVTLTDKIPLSEFNFFCTNGVLLNRGARMLLRAFLSL